MNCYEIPKLLNKDVFLFEVNKNIFCLNILIFFIFSLEGRE